MSDASSSVIGPNEQVAVVGLGYVGLPLALAFGRVMDTIGFDINATRVEQLGRGFDETGEVDALEFARSERVAFSSDPEALRAADHVIVAVPTPIDDSRQPDLRAVRAACKTVGQYLKPGAIVCFESTVYPGLTEEICLPLLEQASGGKAGQDFHLAYSPERINPGDKTHTLQTIVKVVAAQHGAVLDRVAALYERVVDAGVHRARSIRVAEAAKVIENTQRDLNIALINELAIIFNRLGLDTHEVLEAAGTKWNFLPFRPGLVGGHCIGVDPYYLTYKAERTGYHPDVILAGRRINDGMGKYVVEQTIKRMIASGIPVRGARVLVMGLTFKEDCRDIRNTRVVDIIQELESYGAVPVVCDPLVPADQAMAEYGVKLSRWDEANELSAVIAAVAHAAFRRADLVELRGRCVVERPCFADVKSAFDRATLEAAGFDVWRL